MTKYNVIDPNLRQVAKGEQVFVIEAGVIDLPADVADDLLSAGQIEKVSEAAKSAPAAKTNKRPAKPADEG